MAAGSPSRNFLEASWLDEGTRDQYSSKPPRRLRKVQHFLQRARPFFLLDPDMALEMEVLRAKAR